MWAPISEDDLSGHVVRVWSPEPKNNQRTTRPIKHVHHNAKIRPQRSNFRHTTGKSILPIYYSITNTFPFILSIELRCAVVLVVVFISVVGMFVISLCMLTDSSRKCAVNRSVFRDVVESDGRRPHFAAIENSILEATGWPVGIQPKPVSQLEVGAALDVDGWLGTRGQNVFCEGMYERKELQRWK
jgi:hypothetical protein